MMRLWLTLAQAQAIAQHAQDSYPLEACGVIGGVEGCVPHVIPIPNIATNPHRHFRFDEAAFLKAMFGFEKSGQTLLGIYHSHPHSDPIPSPVDIEQAAYSGTAYLIVGLRGGEPALAAWQIRGDAVTRIELYIGDEPPEPEESLLSRAQKTAIILAAVVAFLFMILLSLSLLPPAPIIVSPLP
jgi:proteasome lid subunit RPN8/RPN11